MVLSSTLVRSLHHHSQCQYLHHFFARSHRQASLQVVVLLQLVASLLIIVVMMTVILMAIVLESLQIVVKEMQTPSNHCLMNVGATLRPPPQACGMVSLSWDKIQIFQPIQSLMESLVLVLHSVRTQFSGVGLEMQ
jgi:hypothetical protein